MSRGGVHPSGWITRNYKEDGSLIEIKTKDIDIAFVYLVVLFCVIIAVGGITWENFEHHQAAWKNYITWIAGGIALAIILWKLYTSTLIKRVRFDYRGILYTIGGKLALKIPWKNVKSVKAYEREGGMLFSETIRGIAIITDQAPSKFNEIFTTGSSALKIESNEWGQESVEKAIRVVNIYAKKHDFEAKTEEWEKLDKFMFSRAQ